jgi:hypothetical protein
MRALVLNATASPFTVMSFARARERDPEADAVTPAHRGGHRAVSRERRIGA